MITLTTRKRPIGTKAVPLAWRDTAWSIRVVVRSAAPVYRRLTNLTPLRFNAADSDRFALGRRVSREVIGRKLPVRSLVRPLRGKISNYRPLSCDAARLSRLASFSSLPLAGQSAPHMRVFRYFQNPQSAL
jgi:hypothetical protein